MDAPAGERERQRLLRDPLSCFIHVPGDSAFICKLCHRVMSKSRAKYHLRNMHFKTKRFVCEGCKGELKDFHTRASAYMMLNSHKKTCRKYREYLARGGVPRHNTGDSSGVDEAEGTDEGNGDEDCASEKSVMNDGSERGWQ